MFGTKFKICKKIFFGVKIQTRQFCFWWFSNNVLKIKNKKNFLKKINWKMTFTYYVLVAKLQPIPCCCGAWIRPQPSPRPRGGRRPTGSRPWSYLGPHDFFQISGFQPKIAVQLRAYGRREWMAHFVRALVERAALAALLLLPSKRRQSGPTGQATLDLPTHNSLLSMSGTNIRAFCYRTAFQYLMY